MVYVILLATSIRKKYFVIFINFYILVKSKEDCCAK